MAAIKLRVRSSTGAHTLSVDPEFTLGDLKSQLGASSIRAGYPPKPVTASDTLQLSALFRDGDVVVVSNSHGAPSTDVPKSSAPAPAPTSSARPFVIRQVPDDNSCLFRSVNALLSRPNTSSSVSRLRDEVSAVVSSNPMLYSEAFLGRSNADYCAWIMSDNAWGGAIELSILSERFAVELAAFDVKTMRLDRYGQGAGFANVGFLVYDGIHYNYVAEANRGGDKVLFDVNDQAVVDNVRRVVKKEHDQRKFTDTASFLLRCGQCGTRLRGEKEALAHAQSTGHTNFTEK